MPTARSPTCPPRTISAPTASLTARRIPRVSRAPRPRPRRTPGGYATSLRARHPGRSPPGPQTIAKDSSLAFSVAGGNAFTVIDPESPRVLVDLLTQDGILTLPSTAGLEFPNPAHINNSPSITFYADNPAEANAALD